MQVYTKSPHEILGVEGVKVIIPALVAELYPPETREAHLTRMARDQTGFGAWNDAVIEEVDTDQEVVYA